MSQRTVTISLPSGATALHEPAKDSTLKRAKNGTKEGSNDFNQRTGKRILCAIDHSLSMTCANVGSMVIIVIVVNGIVETVGHFSVEVVIIRFIRLQEDLSSLAGICDVRGGALLKILLVLNEDRVLLTRCAEGDGGPDDENYTSFNSAPMVIATSPCIPPIHSVSATEIALSAAHVETSELRTKKVAVSSGTSMSDMTSGQGRQT